MRSNRQPKRKIIETCEKENESRRGSVKKFSNGTGMGDEKSAGCIPIVADKNPGVLPCKGASLSGQRMESGFVGVPPMGCQIKQKKLSAKMKLQLFPLNENTQLGLEKDGFNPFLELSLSSGKKISSVIKHLNSKWGTSCIACGQLMLFPYNMKLEKIASCRRWTSDDCGVTAGEVYVDVESPSVFRLRYGWLSNIQLDMFGVAPESSPIKVQLVPESDKRSCSRVLDATNDEEEKAKLSVEESSEPINTIVVAADMNELKSLDLPVDHVMEGFYNLHNIINLNAHTRKTPVKSLLQALSQVCLRRYCSVGEPWQRSVEENNEMTTHIVPTQSSESTVHWDDNLTNLSIGSLLSEISLHGKINYSANKSSLPPIGLISDISIGALLSEASLQGKIKIENCDKILDGESSLQPIASASNDTSIHALLSEASLFSNKCNSGVQQSMDGGCAPLQSPWDDNLTILSIGGLLSEASLQEKINNSHSGIKGSKSSIQPNASLSDSFDAFIVSQLNKHSQVLKPASHESQSSILDAEETCHAFPVRKLPSSSNDATDRGDGAQGFNNETSSKPFRFPNFAESVLDKVSSSLPRETDPLSQSRGLYDEDSSLGLSSIKWNESFGPFDLGLLSRHVTSGDNISISEIVR